MIIIRSRLKKYVIDKPFYESFVQKILNELNYPDFDVCVLFTNNKTIRSFNKQFRKKDKPTDVLSFPHHTQLKAGQKIKVVYEDDKALGDVMISMEYAEKDAKKLNVPLQSRIELLIAHSIAHLLGHDHIDDNEYKVMRRLEERLLRAARKI